LVPVEHLSELTVTQFIFMKKMGIRGWIFMNFNTAEFNGSFTSLLLDVYVWLNMFWASPCPSSGAYNCTRSPWF